MPQEIVVPVVTVKHVRGKSAQDTQDQAGVGPGAWQQPSDHHAFYRFQLIQMEPVSDRVKPITLKVAVYEGDEPVTDIETREVR